MSRIILIPGMWCPVGIPVLAASLSQAGHEVVTVKFPGDDGTVASDVIEAGRFSWEDAVAAVEAALDDLPAGSLPILVGEGTGGILAQNVAFRRQTGPLVFVNAPAPVRAWRSPLVLLLVAAKEMIGHTYRGAFRAMISLASCTRPSETAPVLIWSSENHKLVSQGTSLDMLALYPNADYHRSATECPEKISRDIGDWIAAMEEKNMVLTAPETFSRRRTLHHGAPVSGRRDASLIPLAPVRGMPRRVPAGFGRRSHGAVTVSNVVSD